MACPSQSSRFNHPDYIRWTNSSTVIKVHPSRITLMTYNVAWFCVGFIYRTCSSNKKNLNTYHDVVLSSCTLLTKYYYLETRLGVIAYQVTKLGERYKLWITSLWSPLHSQEAGSHTGQLDFCNWLTHCSTMRYETCLIINWIKRKAESKEGFLGGRGETLLVWARINRGVL